MVESTYENYCVSSGELYDIGTRHNAWADLLDGFLGGVDSIQRRLTEVVRERLPFRVRSLQKHGAVTSLEITYEQHMIHIRL